MFFDVIKLLVYDIKVQLLGLKNIWHFRQLTWNLRNFEKILESKTIFTCKVMKFRLDKKLFFSEKHV